MRPCNRSVHRLLITAVMLAAKLTDDNYYNNAFYARVSSVFAFAWGIEELPLFFQEIC